MNWQQHDLTYPKACQLTKWEIIEIMGFDRLLHHASCTDLNDNRDVFRGNSFGGQNSISISVFIPSDSVKTVIECYKTTLTCYAHVHLPCTHLTKSAADRVHAAVMELAQNCPRLTTIAVRDMIYSSSILLLLKKYPHIQVRTPFWAAVPKGSMTYAFTHMGDFLLLLLLLL